MVTKLCRRDPDSSEVGDGIETKTSHELHGATGPLA